MSKMDGLRAMREARYDAAEKRGAAAASARTAPTEKPAAKTPAKKKPAPAPSADETLEGTAVAVDADASTVVDSDDLCGHRAISGRTCTREKGHAAKSHRYA